MEGAYLKLFRDAGVATATQGFMLGVLARLVIIAAGALSVHSRPSSRRQSKTRPKLPTSCALFKRYLRPPNLHVQISATC